MSVSIFFGGGARFLGLKFRVPGGCGAGWRLQITQEDRSRAPRFLGVVSPLCEGAPTGSASAYQPSLPRTIHPRSPRTRPSPVWNYVIMCLLPLRSLFTFAPSLTPMLQVAPGPIVKAAREPTLPDIHPLPYPLFPESVGAVEGGRAPLPPHLCPACRIPRAISKNPPPRSLLDSGPLGCSPTSGWVGLGW